MDIEPTGDGFCLGNTICSSDPKWWMSAQYQQHLRDFCAYPISIVGQLALDQNINCQTNSPEPALVNWKVQLTIPNYALYATTDSSGHYEMHDVPGDDYLLSAIMPANLWESCLGDVPIAIPDTGNLAVVQDLSIQIVADCALMTMDIATSALRRCFSGTYSIHYCNEAPSLPTVPTYKLSLTRC